MAGGDPPGREPGRESARVAFGRCGQSESGGQLDRGRNEVSLAKLGAGGLLASWRFCEEIRGLFGALRSTVSIRRSGPRTKSQFRVAGFGSLVKNFTIVSLSAFCVHVWVREEPALGTPSTSIWDTREYRSRCAGEVTPLAPVRSRPSVGGCAVWHRRRRPPRSLCRPGRRRLRRNEAHDGGSARR